MQIARYPQLYFNATYTRRDVVTVHRAEIVRLPSDQMRHAVIITCEIDASIVGMPGNFTFALANVHLESGQSARPENRRQHQLQALARFVDIAADGAAATESQPRSGELYVIGDFNTNRPHRSVLAFLNPINERFGVGAFFLLSISRHDPLVFI